MEKIYYQTLKETLFHEKLENGLEVYLLPKIGFEKTYGLFSTRFGSIDTTFVPLGQKEMIKVEDGIAHFLEHKMFDMENGDAADEFAKLGASSNAFTSSSRTAYLFSTTTNENDCVELLLDFVQSLNITDESVEKEKGIICQEIKMYDETQIGVFILELLPTCIINILLRLILLELVKLLIIRIKICWNFVIKL